MEFMQRVAAVVARPRPHLRMTASQPSISAVECPVWVDSRPSGKAEAAVQRGLAARRSLKDGSTSHCRPSRYRRPSELMAANCR